MFWPSLSSSGRQKEAKRSKGEEVNHRHSSRQLIQGIKVASGGACDVWWVHGAQEEEEEEGGSINRRRKMTRRRELRC